MIHECTYKYGVENGRFYVKYSSYPNTYIYDFKYKNGKKTGISKSWNIDGTIEEFIFNGPLSLQEIEKDLAKNQFKIFTLDVTADGINDLVISRINDNANLYQGDELYVLIGDKGGKYKLSLSTSNYASDGGYFLYDILPRPNYNGFILGTYFSSKGQPNINYYFTFKNKDWYVSTTTMGGVMPSGEYYYCIDNNHRHIKEYINSMPPATDDTKPCTPPPTKYVVTSDKAEILSDTFESRSPPNYYIQKDTIEAVDQNEDWVQVSYKNGTKFGWIDKRYLKSVSY